ELKKYGNLFKSNVVAGVGGNSNTGDVTPGKNGTYDAGALAKKDPALFRKLLKENPAALGLPNGINR
ncbi:MAG: hypothetical protein KDA84_24445, partial [Planctomycetaceae bacterium]|nr:hypothetical protein [Planctomycetaceae bacterium]